MYIRCSDCHESTWIEHPADSAATLRLDCGTCSKRYQVDPQGDFDNEDAQYESALALAGSNGIDLPSAYSVLLGIMTLETALSLGDRESIRVARGARTPKAAPAPVQPIKVDPWEDSADYDPGFADAVIEGFLTPRQARERGNRQMLVERLMLRHDLSQTLAPLVADNKMSIAIALERRREERRPVTLPEPSSAPRHQTLATYGVLAFVGAAVLLFAWSTTTDVTGDVRTQAPVVAADDPSDSVVVDPGRGGASAEESAASRASAVRVQRDELGRVTEVSAPDPISVLRAYCASDADADRLQSLEIAATLPPFSSARLGVFRDRDELTTSWAIRIRRDRDSHRWVAGDGSGPLRRTPAPSFPDGHERVVVVAQ